MSKEGAVVSIFYYVIVLGLAWLVSAGIRSTYKITDDRVHPQITRVVGTDDYKIIDRSNNSVWVGTPGDVTYNVELPSGEVVSCRCTDGFFQPLICRKYQ
tara:strand:+ start:210893 stop:211192 length:300 start_codon:yes stop_codon:yes gene_type:complete